MPLQTAATPRDRPQPVRRVFARAYAAEGVRAATAAQSAVTAAVSQRRLATLRRIGDLQSSLASLVTSSSSRAVSEGGPRLPQPTPAPQLGDGGLTRAAAGGRGAFLAEAQRQVERLTRENHDLVRRCLELEERLDAVHPAVEPRAAARNGLVDDLDHRAPPHAAHDDGGDLEEVVEDGEDCLLESGAIDSPRELAFFGSYGAGPRAPPPPHGRLPEALYGLLHRVSVCYPELFDGLAPSPAASPSALDAAMAGEDTPATDLRPCSRAGGAEALVASLKEQGVCEVLWRLESVIPGLVSSSRLGDLFTDAGAELLDHIHTLEDEKQADYSRLVEVTERLVRANASLTARDEERRAQLNRLTTELAAAHAQQSRLVDELAEERAAARELAAQRQTLEGHVEARSTEVAALAAAATAAATARAEERAVAEATVARLEERCAAAEVQLDRTRTELAGVTAERDERRRQLVAEPIAVATAAAAPPAHSGVAKRSGSAEDTSDLLPSTPEGEADEEVTADGERADASPGPAAPVSLAELRKVRQSLNRMTHERTALRRRLERQAAQLAEAQAAAESAAERLRTVEAELADARARAVSADGAAPRARAAAPAAVGEPEASEEVELLDFARLEAGAGGAGAVYPAPLPSISSPWLTTVHDEPVVDCAGVAGARLLMGAGGPLYHVGGRIAAHAGLLTERNTRAWGRLLVQLQHTLEARGSPVFTSAYAADCAQQAYALLLAAGLLGGGLSTPDVPMPTRWALVVAALGQCVGGAGRAAPGGEPQWRTVGRILSHVTAACARDGLEPLMATSAEEPVGSEATAVLRALLSYEDSPADTVFHARLPCLALRGCALATSAVLGGGRWTLDDTVAAGQLVLRLSRDAVFFRAPAALEEPDGALLLYGRHGLRPLLTLPGAAGAHTGEGQGAEGLPERSVVARQLLGYLDGAVLPLALAEARLLVALGADASRSATALLQHLRQTRAALVDAAAVGAEDVGLTADHVDALIASCTASSPATLEEELIGLYDENTRYRSHIEKLLVAVESKEGGPADK